ncbi:DmpA family aminopeptidase [Brevibacillus laterosporus]|uniref:DmpA family aminopeptidase n=1 Tax=Brevibacillus laterosporus TaxID=1465 RepID=UPI000E6C9F93|nr:P1 family peptidase [Brevibacillus laterosporus]AYB38085.1 S58 family peptidase [Brevibacillus laterosporus]MBM7110232.1 Peptidase family S58 [Brevibacillus laterosporus]
MNQATRKKVRELGILIGTLPTGKKNCITDVRGVRVGHVTIDRPLDDGKKDYACTGVTAILPHGGNLFLEKVIAASYVINGFGKTTGLVQVNELGVLESPIMLTNTFSVPAVTQGTLQEMLGQNPEIGDTTGTINLVVGECNDGYLNTIRRCVVQPEDARHAIKVATEDQAEEGAIGAGKGMVCFGYKGGIGSSSRFIQVDGKNYTVGVLVLSNFGKKDEFQIDKYKEHLVDVELPSEAIEHTSDGSIIIVLATDAPVNERQLLRMAKRCAIGLGRTGSYYGHGSGDIVIAFSTAHKIPHQSELIVENRIQLREDRPVMNQLFTAASDATEEAILNSLSRAVTTEGRNGRVVEGYSFS